MAGVRSGLDDREQVLVESRAQWRGWLQRHHASSPGIWLVRWKKDTGRPQVGYDAVVEEALCFGWVDSRPRSLDSQRSALLLTPRRPGSSWSRANKRRIEALEAGGRLAPAGVAAVERARADRSWSALDQVETLIEPADLRAALDAVHAARVQWDAFPALDPARHPRMDQHRANRPDPRETRQADRHRCRSRHAGQPVAPTEAQMTLHGGLAFVMQAGRLTSQTQAQRGAAAPRRLDQRDRRPQWSAEAPRSRPAGRPTASTSRRVASRAARPRPDHRGRATGGGNDGRACGLWWEFFRAPPGVASL